MYIFFRDVLVHLRPPVRYPVPAKSVPRTGYLSHVVTYYT